MHVIGDTFVLQGLEMMRMHLGYSHATPDDVLLGFFKARPASEPCRRRLSFESIPEGGHYLKDSGD